MNPDNKQNKQINPVKTLVYGAICSSPFIIIGVLIYKEIIPYIFNLDNVILGLNSHQVVGTILILIGGVLFLIGLLAFIAKLTSETIIRPKETLTLTQHPSQKVALSKVITSIPFIISSLYLYSKWWTPYVYPFTLFIIFLYLFFSGIYLYWSNICTTYYITDKRVIKEYQFVRLRTHEIPLNKIRSIKEGKTFFESLAKLGNVRIASGKGKGLAFTIKNINNARTLANQLRDLI